MIKEYKKKIHFVSFDPAKGKSAIEEPAPTISISGKTGVITFGKGVIGELQMKDRFIKIFYDIDQRIVGWRITDHMNHSDMESWKLCNPNESNIWQTSIKKLRDALKLDLTKTYGRLEIQKYRETAKLSGNLGEIIYFVQISDENAVSPKERAAKSLTTPNQ
jgi:hypothetical protein